MEFLRSSAKSTGILIVQLRWTNYEKSIQLNHLNNLQEM